RPRASIAARPARLRATWVRPAAINVLTAARRGRTSVSPGLTTKRPVKSRTATPSLNVHLISTVVTFNLSRLAAGCVIAEGLHTRSNDAGADSQRGVAGDGVVP